MFFRHGYDKLIYPLVAMFLLVLVSYRPAYRLRPDMPKGFFAADAPCGPKRPLEQKIACAYWDSAQMDIQWKYPHEHPLPKDVPAEFSISAPALGAAASAQATRELYWHRLQAIWYEPDTWDKQYEWNWNWAGDPMSSAAQWLRETASRWFTIR